MDVSILASFLGGVGFFLLGMQLLSEALKLAAGKALVRILSKATKTRFHGLLSGTLITAIVQSSSAVTVAIIGFVNAGLLNLKQAITVIIGSNLGTTITGWLVAILGFEINIKAIALPFIFIGILLELFFRGRKIAFWGQALIGFGLIFVGIDFLKSSMTTLSLADDFSVLGNGSPWDPLLYLGVGLLLTIFIQSSSAAIAVIITAASSFILPMEDAAAMVIGANIGTTTTAMIAAIGATPNAKRVASAHVFFNVMSACVAIVILALLLTFIHQLVALMGLNDSPAITLALFHTLFNLMGVIIILPFINNLTNFLARHFRSTEENESKPHFLDKNILKTPNLAFVALVKELLHMKEITFDAARIMLGNKEITLNFLNQKKDTIESLLHEIARFSKLLRAVNLPERVAAELPTVFRVAQYFLSMLELNEEILQIKMNHEIQLTVSLGHDVDDYKKEIIALLNLSESGINHFENSGLDEKLSQINSMHQTIKIKLLKAATQDEISIEALSSQLDINAHLRQIAEHVLKSVQYLFELCKFENDRLK